MKPEITRLRQEQRTEEEQAVTERLAENHEKEFSSVEELLRYDSANNPVPAEVGERLNASIAAEPRPNKPWYKKLWG